MSCGHLESFAVISQLILCLFCGSGVVVVCFLAFGCGSCVVLLWFLCGLSVVLGFVVRHVDDVYISLRST